MLKAIGLHVFAGAFTHGVQSHFSVEEQLETHAFGQSTAEKMCNVNVTNVDDGSWPDRTADLMYGNPRCTGFSCLTAGCNTSRHGPWSSQTKDIHQLCRYAAGKTPLIIWESVQQAMSVGRPLLNYLRDEIFVPRGYRIAHILLNAASFGNCQQRRRYFFVAYDKSLQFNVSPPDLPAYKPTLYDSIYSLKGKDTEEASYNRSGATYSEGSYMRLTEDEKAIVPFLPNGWSTNQVAAYDYESLPAKYKRTWDERSSNLPFSLHCVSRCSWRVSCPTLHGSASRFIHPEFHRPLTIGEIATIMGWPTIPTGDKPVAQIAKGVCPSVAEWLALQAKYCLTNAWGSDDYESEYNLREKTWVGADCNGSDEKVFNLNDYTTHHDDIERYPDDTVQKYRFNVDNRTGRLIRPWSDVKESFRIHSGDNRLGRQVRERGSRVLGELETET